MSNAPITLPDLLFGFIFLYPLFMSYVWMAGGLFYWFHYERGTRHPDHPPALPSHPRVALVVPCFNEEETVFETVATLLLHDYPHFEVIAVNDGSRDRTGAILDAMVKVNPRLRVLHHAANQGKAVALNTAALMTDAEYLVCIDGDALLDRSAARWMMWHLLNFPRVGAVTGNPRVRNRSTLLGRIQVGEFSSIIGLIKRAQRTYGRLFTVSGVVGAYRKAALHQVGYWSQEMMCEDIDISWKLQLHHWDVRLEPAALCWILMPETFKGLWRQRLRWAMGGVQVMFKFLPRIAHWRTRRMWPMYAEYLVSLMWAYCFALSVLLWAVAWVAPVPAAWRVSGLSPTWPGMLIASTSMMQIAVGMFLDRRYDLRFGRQFYWVIWYPAAFWTITFLTAVVALPKVATRVKGSRALWTSPDRGLR
ncbi:MAG TPA: poly-beta-1,6-N-acetyl-D-glucosamine synthase [Burkholderiaceae bacterium]|jgi:biofilm PGA synthesis N-glycosyltransferase PgaC|nr:poly-beta-1,6-N-acetyl-D-glucosamine synthase [Burkholderiaceae bacterium]